MIAEPVFLGASLFMRSGGEQQGREFKFCLATTQSELEATTKLREEPLAQQGLGPGRTWTTAVRATGLLHDSTSPYAPCALFINSLRLDGRIYALLRLCGFGDRDQ